MGRSTVQIRHNPVVWEKPFFRLGGCVENVTAPTGWQSGISMGLLRIAASLTGLLACAAAGALLWPHAERAGLILSAQDGPARLSEIQINSALRNDPSMMSRQIDAALAAGDADLANSFVELADAHGVVLAEAQRRQVAAAVADYDSTPQVVKRFAAGLVTGNADDMASLSGTVAGDLLVFGDVRDVVKEGSRLASGEEPDRLILGLAAAGLVATAATYVSAGGAAPVRAGLTMVKDARRVGRLGEGLSRWAGRSARDVVDASLLRNAVASASVAHPGQTMRAVKAAFRTEKAGALVRFAKDVGRIGEKAGTRGAFDVLKIAESPKDVARAARLAESKGGQTRAILKMLGRGALLMATGAFNLALWLFWALLALAGFLASIKSTTERLTWTWLQRRKAKRLRALQASASTSEQMV
jgi:hypothetical protein